MELTCKVQNYHWGKTSDTSAVAELAASNDPQNVVLDPAKRYAEFWMGTHPNAPSSIKSTGQLLLDYLNANSEAVSNSGSNVTNLPYLFKVLSVDTALSIQVHPCKSKAVELHRDRPDIYKDDNHKPEMALALTEFEGLCGFRNLESIKHNLQFKCPEIKELVKIEPLLSIGDDYSGTLKACFAELLMSEKAKVVSVLDKMKARVAAKADPDVDDRLFLRLMGQYPGDIGCLVMFFLNVVTLQPGEAMFLGANVPHAYLSGDCVECMSRSDNVIRAGLTPKLIDVPALLDNLDYKCVNQPSDVMFKPSREDPHTLLYDPPVPDFSVAKIDIDQSEKCDLKMRQTGSIVVVTGGSAKYQFKGSEGTLGNGTVLFVPANTTVSVSDAMKLQAFQAFF